MESLLVSGKVNFEVLNNNENLLQVVLMPDQGIYTEASYIQYFSSNLSVRDLAPAWFIRWFKSQSGLRLRAKNRKGGIEYLGLSKGCGKIIAINPSIFNETFYIDKNFILGYSSGIKARPQLLDLQSFCTKEWLEVKGNDLVFLQGNNGFIEKKLGLDEEINLQVKNLLGFTNNVKFETCRVFQGFERFYMKCPAFLKAKGPGTVFFVGNSNTSQDLADLRRDSKKIEWILCLFLMTYFFLDIWNLI